MKRIIAWAGIVLLLAVVGVGAYLYFVVGAVGESGAERLISNQLKSIANGYLNPELSWDELDFQRPKTCTLTNARLTAQHPETGEPVDVLSVEKMTIEFVGPPRRGKPVRIERMILDRPTLRVIDAGEAGLIGLTDLVKAEVLDAATATAPAEPPPAAADGEPAPALSDVFELRLIKLVDASIAYDVLGDDQQPMTLDGINTELTIAPSVDGTHTIALGYGSGSALLTASLAGAVDLDAMRLKVDRLAVNVELGESTYGRLPPQLQKIARDYAAQGALRIEATGLIDANDPLASTLKAGVELLDVSATYEGTRVPLDRFTVDAAYDGKLASARFTAEAESVYTVEGDLYAPLPVWSESYQPLTMSGLKVEAEVSPQLIADLPERWRAALDGATAEGTLRVSGYEMQTDLAHPLGGSINWIRIDLDDGHVAKDDYSVPIDELIVTGSYVDRRVNLNRLELRALGGKVSLFEPTGAAAPKCGVRFDEEMAARLRLDVAGVRLERALGVAAGTQATQAGEDAAPPDLAGELNGRIRWHGSLANWQTQSHGSGAFSLTDARLARMPVISTFLDLLRGLLPKGKRDEVKSGNERVDMVFRFAGDRVAVTKLDASGPWYSVEGTAILGLEPPHRLHGEFNGGPLEKAQAGVPILGEASKLLSQGAMHYEVRGWADQMGLAVEPGPRKTFTDENAAWPNKPVPRKEAEPAATRPSADGDGVKTDTM